MVVKAHHLCSMRESTNWFWDQHSQHQVITMPTCTILHPQLDVIVIKDIHDIPNIVFNITQGGKTYQDILFV